MKKNVEKHTEKKILGLVEELEKTKRDRDYWKLLAQRKNRKKLK